MTSARGEWLTIEEVAEALGINQRSVRRRAIREGWPTRVAPCRGGHRLEIHRSVLGGGGEPNEAGLLRLSGVPGWAVERAEARRDLIVLVEERLEAGSRVPGR